MNDNDILLQIKVEKLTIDLQKAAEEVGTLVTPLNAIKFYAEDLLEDHSSKDIDERITGLDNAARKCIVIVKRLSEITLPYLRCLNRRLK